MHHFQYLNGVLHAEEVPLPDIAAHVGTPFYCYSTATLTSHYRLFEEAMNGLDPLICFSAKANGNLAVLRTLANMGHVFLIHLYSFNYAYFANMGHVFFTPLLVLLFHSI